MKDLTSQDLQQILGKIKSFLDITWDDADTESDVTDFIYSGINFLDTTAGAELDYLFVPSGTLEGSTSTNADVVYDTMCLQAQPLLKNYCFYCREKALDDFKSNYQKELVALYFLGKIYKRLNEDVEQQ